DARPAEARVAQARKGRRQELQHQVFEHRDQVADNDKQTAFPHPLGCRRVLVDKVIPYIHARFSFPPACRRFSMAALRVILRISSTFTRTMPMIQKPFSSISRPSTMPMLTIPPVILAMARSGIL